MGGQSIERREILQYIGMASVAATFPGFSRWSFACDHAEGAAHSGPAPAHPYRPLFFSATQFLMVERLAEMIIPADDTPGAKEAGVAEFIDFMVANRVPVTTQYQFRSTADTLRAGSQIQERFVAGLQWLDAQSKSEYGNKFINCSSQEQNAQLEAIAYKSKYKPGTEAGREFFSLMRTYTVIGYYTTKIGLESIDFPGLRTMWPNMPGCSHPDDPEHTHLQDAGPSDQDGRLTVLS